jgi:hypothetical protein
VGRPYYGRKGLTLDLGEEWGLGHLHHTLSDARGTLRDLS